MISYFETNLENLSVHHVGNKFNDGYLSLSDEAIGLRDVQLRQLLLKYFLFPFEKVNEVYGLFNENNQLDLNDIYKFVSGYFSKQTSFHEMSTMIARHLFEVSTHPKIKDGEVYVSKFSDIQLNGQLCDAIGIFKSETKEPFLKVTPVKSGFEVSYEQEAININKLDKGCLICNLGGEEGFQVLVVDHTNRSQDAQYWKDDFLKVKIRNNEYNQTQTILNVYKNFVTKKLDDDFQIERTEKIDLLNKSMKYFKEKEVFDLEEFNHEVIGNEQGISSFLAYKNNYEEELGNPISDSFDINDAAVKKQERNYKSVLKLDKNFHIYIHGDKKLIEKGFDQDRSMNFYKVYFRDED